VIRAVLGVIVVGALLFIADQEFAEGRYTTMGEKAIMKIKKTVGI